jgi:hypothetical protein
LDARSSLGIRDREAERASCKLGGPEGRRLACRGYLYRPSKQVCLDLHQHSGRSCAAVCLQHRDRWGTIGLDGVDDVNNLMGHRLESGTREVAPIGAGVHAADEPCR